MPGIPLLKIPLRLQWRLQPCGFEVFLPVKGEAVLLASLPEGQQWERHPLNIWQNHRQKPAWAVAATGVPVLKR